MRPEFVTLTDGEGLPVKVRRVEDVGRYKIVRADLFGSEINIIANEDASISPDMTRVAFDPAHVNVYVDDWRREGKAA